MSGIFIPFFGGGEPVIIIVNFNANSDVVTPTNAVCQYELTNGGDVRATQTTNTVNDVGDWISPKAFFSNYDVFLHVNSGTSPAGASLDTWLNLGTTRTWTLTESAIGTLSNNMTLQIRNAITLTVKASVTITMTATKST